MKLFGKSALLVGLLGLVACTPSQEAINAASFSVAETNTPVDLFASICLKTLPDFKGFDAIAKARDLELIKQDDFAKIYKAKGNKHLISTLASEDSKTACGVAFLGPADAEAFGAQFLSEATKRTGGSPKEKLPSSFFQYAYHLRNGSVLTYDIRRKSGQIQHIFLISPPVPKEDVADLIYN